MPQVLASGKTGSNKYDLKATDPNKVFPRLDARQIAQSLQYAYEVAQGFSYSGNEGSSSALDDDLSIITTSNIATYSKDLAQLIQTFVSNNCRLDVDGASTANAITLNAPYITEEDAPDGNNYKKTTPLPFTFEDNLKFSFRATANNTGPTTISIPGLSGLTGSIDLVDEDGNDLVGGEMIANKFYEIVLTGKATTKKAILKNSKNSLGNISVNKLNTQPNSATISSGSITYTGAYMLINGEGNVDDELNTINGGQEGDVLILKSNNNGIITINDNDISSGNIALIRNNSTRTLEFSVDTVVLMHYDSGWVELLSNTDAQFSSSKSTNGYTYLPNGLIFQWGNNSVTSGATVTLPVAFSTAFFTATTSHRGISVTLNTTYNTSGLTGIVLNHSGTGSVEVTWWAVGY